MSDQALVYGITIPAGFGSNTITYFDFNFGDFSTEKVYITFPPGCAGNVLTRLEFNESPAYPTSDGQWFDYDGYVVEVDVTNQPTTGQWRAAMINTDRFDHTLHFDFRLNYVPQPTQSATTPLVSL